MLAKLATDYGVPVRTGTRIEVKLSQKDLGTLVGASREKVNKQIRQWEEDGVLRKDSGRMVVVDAAGAGPDALIAETDDDCRRCSRVARYGCASSG